MLPFHYSSPSSERLLTTYLTLNQYPILCGKIRSRMRKHLFTWGAMDKETFEQQVRLKSVETQQREGVHDPLNDEPAELWEKRMCAIRDQLTDFYFSLHFTYQDLELVIQGVLEEKGIETHGSILAVNPELAPLEQILEQAKTIEQMTGPEKNKLEARLSELKVVLIRNLISDQLRYINIAKEWYTVSDLEEVRKRKIGSGRIGGKAAGMLLAKRILNQSGDDDLRDKVKVPETFYLGADVFYNFMEINQLVRWNDQKYKHEDEMRAEFSEIQSEFEAGRFPIEVMERLGLLLRGVGKKPLIVRSSSLLEDNFGTSFAGKYDSWFCPNQGSEAENLKELSLAIARVYSSTLNPNALLYRRSKGLQDYDERMAILIQVVEGEEIGKYYLPAAAGVAFSRNLYRWAPQIRREDGFVRLVWGLGTRAVDRVGNDYPRLVALSHPQLRPNSSTQAILKYSQQYVDLIDFETNEMKTLPVHDVLTTNYDGLRYVAQEDQDGFLCSIRSNVIEGGIKSLRITMEEFLRRTPFAERMRQILKTLEHHYQSPVDMEFTARIIDADKIKPDVEITILQCRPQSQLDLAAHVEIPIGLSAEDTVFSIQFMVPEGLVPDIDTVIFVEPEEYYALETEELRTDLGRAIGKLNNLLSQQSFICVGPGRWGTSNPDLGVNISYGDIYHARSLIELTGQGFGHAPEPSFGTHFFQDLLESQIFPLAINLDDTRTEFNHKFFYETQNHLLSYLPDEDRLLKCLRVIKVNDYRPDHRLILAMDDMKGKAVAYFKPESQSV